MDIEVHNDRGPKHIVIVGGGFAGLNCALELAADPSLRITLIDRNNFQQFSPLLYQVAVGLLSVGNAAFALRDIFREYPNVDVQMGEVESIDLEKRSVNLASGAAYSGEFLVLAMGAQVNFYGTPGAERTTFPLYSLKNAERLRSAILEAFESADQDVENIEDGALNFVVVGAGPTGVEMAGTLSDMLNRMLEKEFRHLRRSMANVFLVDRNSSVLAAFAPSSQPYALSALRERGVQLHLGVAVERVDPDRVVLSNGVTLSSRTVIWAAGVKANSAAVFLNPVVAMDGRVAVNGDLSVRNFDRVFAIGDMAGATDSNAGPLPQLAAVAKQAGKHCARNIIATIQGKSTVVFTYQDRGILAMVGRNAAIAELGSSHHELVGPIAFVTWLGVHAALLTVNRAKLEAIVEWGWTYFFREHAGQLIDK
jgi:NADH dehydrogenase